MADAPATPKWHVKGDFLGSCSCDYLRCPCPQSNYAEAPNRGWCKICIAFHFESGTFGDTKLDDLNVAVVVHSPGAMADGGWSIGLIVDDRADQDQVQALVGIMSGQAGGPMTMASAWVANFLGLEQKPVTFEKSADGKRFKVFVDGMLDYATEPTAGADRDQPVFLDNVWHPANTRVALAKSTRNHVHAFGIDFDGDGGNFAASAPFEWSSD